MAKHLNNRRKVRKASKVSDLEILFQQAKILDPSSTIRFKEFKEAHKMGVGGMKEISILPPRRKRRK